MCIMLQIGFLIVAVLFLLKAVMRTIRRKIRLAKEYKQRQQIGKRGEEDTVRQLERCRGYKRILRNLYVPVADGKNTTEIDAVMIHEKGIIVLENKNYAGKIYGDEDEFQWIQVQKNGRKKLKKHFYSPVKQNQAHIQHLKRYLLGAAKEQETLKKMSPQLLPYLSFITFNDSARLKWISIHSEDILVTESRKVRRRLRWRLRQMPRALTRTQVDELYGMLRPLEHPGKYVKRQHERYAAHGKEGRNFPGTFTKNT